MSKHVTGVTPPSKFNEQYYKTRRDRAPAGIKGYLNISDAQHMTNTRELAFKLKKRYPEVRKALVLGCGRGEFVLALQEVGVNAIGVDHSSYAVNNLVDGLSRNSVVLGDITHLSFVRDDEYDIVLALDIFNCIKHPALLNALKEAARVGRRVLIDVPVNPDDSAPDMSSIHDNFDVSVYSQEWWIQKFLDLGLPYIQGQRYVHPEPRVGTKWEKNQSYSASIYFEKDWVHPTAKTVPKIKIADGGETFKLLWWANAPHTPCFDVNTEVLTKDGFKYFKDLTLDDYVATLNSETNTIEYHKPEAVINEAYDGLMYRHESNHLSIYCTPNHKLYVKKRSMNKFELLEAQEVYGKYGVEHYSGGANWEGANPPHIVIPRHEYHNSVKHIGNVDSYDFMKFLGWYLAEGSYTMGSKREHIVGLALNKRESEEVLEICKKTFPTLTWFKTEEPHKDNIRTYSKELYSLLEPLGRSYQKHVPHAYKNLSKKHLQILLDALMRGDGTERKGTYYLTTSSTKLRDDVNEIAIKLGYRTQNVVHGKKGSTKQIEGRTVTQNHDSWKVTVSKNRLTPAPHQKHFREEYIPSPDGRIYCAVVQNHIMVVRRNNKIYFSGNTGYGVGTEQVVYKAAEAYNVAVLCNYGLEGKALRMGAQGGRYTTSPIMYPKLFEPSGGDAASLVCQNWKPDIAVTLFDIWVGEGNNAYTSRPPGWMKEMLPYWIAYVPIDHDPIPYPILNQCALADRVVAMSRFGKNQLTEKDVGAEYIPHGVYTDTFTPCLPEDKPKWKENLTMRGTPMDNDSKHEWSNEDFVIGINAANKDTKRKGYDEMFKALNHFLVNNPDAVKDTKMYLHTWGDFPGGMSLYGLARAHGVEAHILTTHKWYMYSALTNERKAELSNGFDICMNLSRNEGFGIPIIEAQSCGVPTIATDFTSMTELVKGNGWLVSPVTYVTDMLMSNTAIPNFYEAAEYIEKAYNSPDTVRRLGEKARANAVKKYDVESVIQPLWMDLFEDVRRGLRSKPKTTMPKLEGGWIE